MANNIVFSRIDSRLIHGQVATKWTTNYRVTHILVVDRASATDDFLSMMLRMAAPMGTSVVVATPEKAAEMYAKGELANGRWFCLFKDVENVAQAFDAGLKMESLDVGNLPMREGAKSVLRSISVTQKDIDMLRHCAEGGMEIYFQIFPGDPKLTLEKAEEKFSK